MKVVVVIAATGIFDLAIPPDECRDKEKLRALAYFLSGESWTLCSSWVDGYNGNMHLTFKQQEEGAKQEKDLAKMLAWCERMIGKAGYWEAISERYELAGMGLDR